MAQGSPTDVKVAALDLVMRHLLIELSNSNLTGGRTIANNVRRKAMADGQSQQNERPDLLRDLTGQIEAICKGVQSDRMDGT